MSHLLQPLCPKPFTILLSLCLHLSRWPPRHGAKPGSPAAHGETKVSDIGYPGKLLAQQTAAQVEQEKTRRARFDFNPSPRFKCLDPECRALCGIHSPECFAGTELTEERAESISCTAVSDLRPRHWIKYPIRFASGCFLEGTRPSDCEDCEDYNFVYVKKISSAHTHRLSRNQR